MTCVLCGSDNNGMNFYVDYDELCCACTDRLRVMSTYDAVSTVLQALADQQQARGQVLASIDDAVEHLTAAIAMLPDLAPTLAACRYSLQERRSEIAKVSFLWRRDDEQTAT
jgi:hypothetical protein